MNFCHALSCSLYAVFTRLLVASLLIPVLAAMLALTTPIGTGEGVHQNDLLHPIFPHVHLIDGRIVSDQHVVSRPTRKTDASLAHPPRGPALGAGGGADDGGLGLGLVPTVPVQDVAVPSLPAVRLRVDPNARPAEFRDAPEDPPPDVFA